VADGIVRVALHLAILLVLPPLLLGVANRTKSWVSGRAGPPLLQTYADIARLLRKGFAFSATTSWVFPAGPLVALGSALLAGLFVPFGAAAPLAFSGDAVAVLYLLALGRFFTAAAALDTGSAFEGMGASREVSFACLAEPVVFFALLALYRFTGSLELSVLLGPGAARTWGTAGPSLALLAAALFVVLLAEGCRIPFDDPNTHLELTMIHEVMVLDHSGPLLGAVLYGAAVKLLLFAALLVQTAVPVATGTGWVDQSVFVLGILAAAVGIGIVESVMARLRLVHVPTLLVGACVFAGFGFLLALR
jgi:formate hydrogenlyase subunit 4